MNNMNVELITNIMKFLKNKDEVIIQSKSSDSTYEGVIEKFDGNNLRLSTGDMLECTNIIAIHKKPPFDFNRYIGKRVIILGHNQTQLDGVACALDVNSLSVITENGVEKVELVEIENIEINCESLFEGKKEHVRDDIEDGTAIEQSEEDSTTSGNWEIFKTPLVEGSFYLFEKELEKVKALSESEKKECLEKFDAHNYDFVLECLEKRKNEDTLIDGIINYLKEVIERYKMEKMVVADGSLLSEGIIATKIEKNLDKGFNLFFQYIDENPESAYKGIYRILSSCLVSNNAARGVEAIDLLFDSLKKISPSNNQLASLKAMLQLCQNAKNWDKYLEVLEYLISITESHPVACTNSILRYSKIVEVETKDDRIINLYIKAISLGQNQFESLLRLSNYISSVNAKSINELENDIDKLVADLQVNEIWSGIKGGLLERLTEAEDKYSLIDELVSGSINSKGKTDSKDKKQIVEESKEEYLGTDDDSEVTKEQKNEPLDEESRLEQMFSNHRKRGDYAAAKGHFSALLKKHDSDMMYMALNFRAGLYFAEYTSYNKNKKSFSERYGNAMSKWLVDQEPSEAERLFMECIISDSSSKGAAILSYIDMKAVEFGLKEGISVLLDLQQEIKYCERNEKVGFYEKKYSISFLSGEIPTALSALETLRTIYYNKTKLGNCWYRTGECYIRQEKWKQARNSYEKAIEYGYMKSICEHQVDFCRKNMGEQVKGEAKEQIKAIDSIDIILDRIESYYNDLNYKEANKYVSELAENYPDNEEIGELAKKVESTLQRFIDNAITMPKRKDSQAIALRAWHIENNYTKARKFFEEEINKKGPKYISSIMDLSELLLHTEGVEAAILSLESYEPVIKKLKMSEQSGFYEKLYLLCYKKKDPNKTISVLDELIGIYSGIGKKDKEAFSYFRGAVVCFQDKRYEQTIAKMQKAISGGYHSNVCYKCVAFSYAYLGEKENALSFIKQVRNSTKENDSNLQISLNEIEEHVIKIFENSINTGQDESEEKNHLEIDEFSSEIMLGFNTRFEAFFVERYGTKPVGISLDKFEQNGYKESDIIRLEREAEQHKLRERTGFFGTAAYIENQINGNSSKYYQLLRKSANSWGSELQNNSYFNSACACYAFSLENNSHASKFQTLLYLRCIARQNTYIIPDTDEELRKEAIDLISNIMDLIDVYGESILRELVLLIDKSKYLRVILSNSKLENFDIWMSQLANYISVTEQPHGYPELFESISKKCRQDENTLLDFSNKVRNSKAFNEEQLEELKSFKENVYLFDTDIKYLNSLVNAYEKGIEIYDYEDYDNRMATIGNVQNQLKELISTIDVFPTYFGINYLSDIIENLQEILMELSKRTKEELKPELTVQIPIADVPVVEGKQGISVTVFNKENAASAKDVHLRVIDVDGNELTDDISIAQYLKGGRSASKEFEIPSQGETYTVKLLVNYIDHEDNRQLQESLVSISSAKDVFEPIKSPYFTGDSIDVSQPGIFVGRDVLLDTLENALVNNRSGCEIIYGQKRCGKSSIANFLEDRLKDSFVIIKFSIGAARSPKSIYTNVKDLIIEKIDDLIDSEDIIEGIDEDLLDEVENKKIDDDEDFVSFIRLVHRKLCKPLGKEIMLMIDEFTHLYRYVKEDRRQVAAFMDTWKKLLEADLFKAVLIGQDTMPNFIKEFQNQFQVTQPIRVDRLDDESVRKLIEEPLRLGNGESRFMENSAELIAGWFFGQPYYIQLYCNRLVEQMNIDKRVRVTNALAEKVKSLMLEEADEDLFDNLISRGDESGTEGECYEILKRIAQLTKNSEWADLDDIQIENKAVLIDDLINRAVIRKKDNKCKILISFFREWLNMN